MASGAWLRVVVGLTFVGVASGAWLRVVVGRTAVVVAEGRRNISSGGPFEASVGYSRAVAIGDSCWVAGTTDAGPDGRSLHPGDAGAQARAILAIAERALGEAGFGPPDVVRTRMFVVRPEDVDAVTAAHGEVFRSIRPVATLVLVAALMDPSFLVEIEFEARRA